MTDRFAESRRLFERAQRSIAGGINSGIRKMEQPVPLYFTRGAGARLWDVDGGKVKAVLTGIERAIESVDHAGAAATERTRKLGAKVRPDAHHGRAEA